MRTAYKSVVEIHMREIHNAFKIVVGKPKERRSLRRLRIVLK
jgi:hypothetical protein